MLFLTKILVKTSEIKNKTSQPWKIFTYVQQHQQRTDKQPDRALWEAASENKSPLWGKKPVWNRIWIVGHIWSFRIFFKNLFFIKEIIQIWFLKINYNPRHPKSWKQPLGFLRSLSISLYSNKKSSNAILLFLFAPLCIVKS